MSASGTMLLYGQLYIGLCLQLAAVAVVQIEIGRNPLGKIWGHHLQTTVDVLISGTSAYLDAF